MANYYGGVERSPSLMRNYCRSIPGRSVATPAIIGRARTAYDIGVRRQAVLGRGLFADPAWNILLDLFLSNHHGRDLSVTAACIGSGSSSATALRYIAMLVQRGLVDRMADEHDRRRTYVRLTAKGWNAMVALFDDPAAH